jgi:SAM-dependent methyltransferase
MSEWNESVYGARIASVYDDAASFGARGAGDPSAAVDFLTALADSTSSRTLLELGSGTGRLLIALAERGYQVEGVELSPEMVGKMRVKTAEIAVLVGDMTSFDLGRKFGVVFLAFNTLHFLASQERQLACLTRAAEHLDPAGVVVCEAFLPYPLTRLPPRGVTTVEVGVDELVLIPYRHDQVLQVVESSIVTVREDGIKLYPYRTRYVWPPELDLMAQLAGLRLRERWSDWERSPFHSGSDSHVSVFTLAE